MRKIVLLFLALCFISCEERTKEDWQAFTQVYTDYLKLATADTARVENRDAYLSKVLADHAMSRTIFDQYFLTLKRNPEKLHTILQSINKELREVTNTPVPRHFQSNRSDK
jgi:hypothetical protein